MTLIHNVSLALILGALLARVSGSLARWPIYSLLVLWPSIAMEFRPPRWPAWWLGGLAFIGIELVAHLALLLRGRPSFYDGRG